MNIFSELEGRKGEDLVMAIFRVLLLRSQEVRERFVSLLSDASRIQPLELQSHFTCLSQRSTEDPSTSQLGRLDLLIETDDAVIGIENKLFAAFQEGQPQKYLDTIRSHAEGLATLRQRESLLYEVFVIAPEARSKEVHARINGNEHLTFVAWESILKRLVGLEQVVDPATQVILTSFTEYLGAKLAFIPKFLQWLPHLKRHFDAYSAPLQEDVVRKLWEFFPDAAARLSHGRTWVGYGFSVNTPNDPAWFGYVDAKQEIKTGGRNEAELIVVTSFPVPFQEKDFRPIVLRNKHFLPSTPTPHAWAIEYDGAWRDPDRWRAALEPLNAKVETRLTAARQQLEGQAERVGAVQQKNEADHLTHRGSLARI